jgi:hypothetical protein
MAPERKSLSNAFISLTLPFLKRLLMKILTSMGVLLSLRVPLPGSGWGPNHDKRKQAGGKRRHREMGLKLK